jgi:beta-1,4-N-acetylglucosaminyltransferase
MVVSHAGAGSVMEALRLRKPLLVVTNDALMDAHQSELGKWGAQI